jgi:hypothetical protein
LVRSELFILVVWLLSQPMTSPNHQYQSIGECLKAADLIMDENREIWQTACIFQPGDITVYKMWRTDAPADFLGGLHGRAGGSISSRGLRAGTIHLVK